MSIESKPFDGLWASRKIEEKLDQALVNSPVIEIPACRTGKDDGFKGLFVSDLHLGLADEADDFEPNAKLCFQILKDYRAKGFRIFVLGDCYELWENASMDDIKKTYPNLCNFLLWSTDRIRGNHDQRLILPQSYLLYNGITGKQILLIHGHQGNFFCDEGYPLGWFFTKYVWKNLQRIGFKDPTTAMKEKNPKKHELTRIAFRDWALGRKQTVIFGHTHFAESDPPYYWNCGSWVGNGGQAVEIVGDEITLKQFS